MRIPFDRVVYSNRMGPTNWAFILLGFLTAWAVLLTQGIDALHAALGVLAVLLVTLLVTVPVIIWIGRRQVAELTLRGDWLELEMLTPFGRGRRWDLPMAEAADWSLTKIWPTLGFRHGARRFSMPLQGAVLDRGALKEIAPTLTQTLK